VRNGVGVSGTPDTTQARDELAKRGVLRTLAQLAEELHGAIDDGLDAGALHDVVGFWEANNLNEDVSFESMVEAGEPTRCDDCGGDVAPYDELGHPDEESWEWYMVTDEVWEAAGRGGGAPSFLCIGCLEDRIGRTLTSADFPDVPLNEPDGLHSPRLAARLDGGPSQLPSVS
jgi:hypothetical protein